MADPNNTTLTKAQLHERVEAAGTGVLDLSECNVSGANFSSLRATEVLARFTHFSNCQFAGANLFGAEWQQASFEECSFIGAILRKSTFHDVVLSACNFSNCDLSDAEFIGAHMDACHFEGANLRNGVISDCTIASTTFVGADCTSAAISDNTETAVIWSSGAAPQTKDS